VVKKARDSQSEVKGISENEEEWEFESAATLYIACS
jgi:hypothetical protein